MVVNLQQRIQEKLDQCKPYHDHLVELRSAIAKPDADWVVWGAAERYLQLAIECAIDVGEMIISWKRLERAEENRDVFLILGREGVLDPELARSLAGAAGLRNVLVHQYGRLDRDKLRQAIRDDLKDLEAFATVVAGLLR